MKKILAFALAAIMLMSMMAGCTGGGNGDAGTELPDEPEGHITLSVGVPQSTNISSYTDNDLTRWIEEQLDVTLEFTYYSSNQDEARQQFSLDCAAGKDIPDVIWGFHGMSVYDLGDLGEDGFIMDLKPYLETNFPNFQAALQNVSERDRKVALEKGVNPDDGGYYGMPIISGEDIDNLGDMVYINKVWLDKVGMDMPTTVDELYDVLVAFRDSDCNENGKKDEIPMAASSGSCNGLAAWLMNAFIYWDPNNIYNVDDNGKIYSPMVTDEFRQGLQFINKLYNEGLFNELSFSGASYTDFIAINTPSDNVAKTGIIYGHPAIYTDANTKILDQYTALPYLKDATGKGGYTVFHGNNVGWISFITNSCDTPKRAMEFLDLFYTDEATTRVRWGEKGVFWDYGEEGLTGRGMKSTIHVEDSSAFFSGNSTWGINGNMISTDQNYSAVYIPKNDGSRDDEVDRLYYETWKNVAAVRTSPKYVAEALVYTSEDFDRRQELMSRYFTYYTETMTLFCVGQLDIGDDAVWQEYVNTLDSLGREELEGIAQRAYDMQVG